MTVRSDLHQFADTLPSPAAEALLKYARWLAVHEGAAHRRARALDERGRTTSHAAANAAGWSTDVLCFVGDNVTVGVP